MYILEIRGGGPWDSTKGHRRMSWSHDGICIWFWVSTKLKPFSFPYFSSRNINHVSKLWVSTLFLSENLELAQNSNHFCLKLNFSSNFMLTQGFRTKKVSQSDSEFWHVIDISRRKIRKTGWFEFCANSKSNAYAIVWQWHPSMDFCAISRTPRKKFQFFIKNDHFLKVKKNLEIFIFRFHATYRRLKQERKILKSKNLSIYSFIINP